MLVPMGHGGHIFGVDTNIDMEMSISMGMIV